MGVFAAAGGWPGVLGRLAAGEHLEADLAAAALRNVLDGEATAVQTAGFLMGLRTKGESAVEVAAMVEAMLAAAAPLDLPDPDGTVDIVGTGGSAVLRGAAFNVSTMASVVAAAAGAVVCKHGNRKASSTSGSTDLLEALGVEVELDGPGVATCVREAGVGFAFARIFHPAMRHAAPVRAELGIPTVFNLLGPLSHPGRVRRQLLGVTDPAHLDLMADALARRGALHAWVVHGEGLDELTVTGPSTVVEVRDGSIEHFEVDATELGMAVATHDDIAVGDPDRNAEVATAIFDGRPGPLRDMVVLNAGAALVVAGEVEDLAGGVRCAADALDDGRAARTLGELVAVSRALTHGAGEDAEDMA